MLLEPKHPSTIIKSGDSDPTFQAKVASCEKWPDGFRRFPIAKNAPIRQNMLFWIDLELSLEVINSNYLIIIHRLRWLFINNYTIRLLWRTSSKIRFEHQTFWWMDVNWNIYIYTHTSTTISWLASFEPWTVGCWWSFPFSLERKKWLKNTQFWTHKHVCKELQDVFVFCFLLVNFSIF